MRLNHIAPAALQEYQRLIDSPDVPELALQRFMEENTEFIPTFVHDLHHGLFLNAVFSQYPIGNYKSDFLFFTKHTQMMRAVFIELEASTKRLFLNSGNYTRASAELNAALDQIRAWKRELHAHHTVLEHFACAWHTIFRRPIDVKFTLVIGRDDEINMYPDRKLYLSRFGEEEGIHVLTYDSIVRYLQRADKEAVYKRCVFAAHVNGFRIKVLDGVPDDLLVYFSPDSLHLEQSHIQLLTSAGYRIHDWRSGRLQAEGLRARPIIAPEEERLGELLRAARDNSCTKVSSSEHC
jgi:hypothetical protein